MKIFGILTFLLGINIKQKLINLSDYSYPKPDDPNYNYIAIVETTDIHGYSFSRPILSMSEDPYMKGKSYYVGGMSLFNTYLNVIRKEWGNDRVLYFDIGDKFQGGLESTITNGTIMTELSNYQGLDVEIIGNHEFDYGFDYVKEQIKKSEFDWLTTNFINNETGKGDIFDNITNYIHKKVFTLYEDIKIGVISYTPNFDYYSGIPELKKIKYLKYDYIERLAKELKEIDNVNAVILLTHNGIVCPKDSQKLGIWTRKNSSAKDKDNDDLCEPDQYGLFDYLQKIPKGLIDVILGGDIHYPNHHFFNGIPLIQSRDKLYDFHIVYLPFDKKNGVLKNKKIKVEGPIPVCNLISEKTKRCEYSERNDRMFPFYFHNFRINFDREIEEKVLNKYKKEFLKYRKILCYNKDGIYERKNRENLIGNLMTDVLRKAVKADFSILNSAAFRSTWYPGNIYLEDVYNMYPFPSKIVKFELTGEEFYQLIEVIKNDVEKLFSFSGFRQYLKYSNTTKNNTIIKLTFMNGTLINKNATYTIATNEFLAEGGDSFKYVKHYFKNLKFISGIKEELEKYLLKEKILKSEKYYSSNPTKRRIIFENDN